MTLVYIVFCLERDTREKMAKVRTHVAIPARICTLNSGCPPASLEV